jgi:uncharacterized repeat protein (TIGR03803 family)
MGLRSVFFLAGALVVFGLAGGLGATMAAPSQEHVLYDFLGGSDGADPEDGLIVDRSGAFYGVTTYGGGGCPVGCGTVFKLTPSAMGYNEQVLYRFRGGRDGSNPQGGLIADKAGALYGTTVWGGLNGQGSGTGYGVVFKLTPSASGYVESVIHAFTSGADGANPYGRVIIDDSGGLYGTTSAGGSAQGCGDCGTVFKLTPVGTGYSERILHRFAGSNDGYDPEGGLLADNAGALYGTTVWGGGGYGTVFKLSPSRKGYAEIVLYRFRNLRRGANPASRLIADSAGSLYGTTTYGGAYGEGGSNYGDGTVFKLTPSREGYVESVLHSFRPRTDGENPQDIIADKAGALYGTTCCFGAGSDGTAFKLTPSGTNEYTETILYHFSQPSGGLFPSSPLIADRSGALYGLTSNGGSGCGCGTVFKLMR